MNHRNPARTREEAIALFRKLIREKQGGTESLRIAQDVLEEAGVTLADASLDSGELDPHAGSNAYALGAGGAFYLIGNPDGEGEPDDVFVVWHIRQREAGARGYNAEFIVNFGVQTLVRTDPNLYQSRDEAVFRAVEYAWHIIKVMHRIGLYRTMDALESALDVTGEFAGRSVSIASEEPRTQPWLVSKFGEHRRPGGPERPTRQQRGRRWPKLNSAHGPQGRLRDRDQRHYLVVRINRDPSDTHAAEIHGELAEALEQALDIALPDEGAIIEYTLVWARDAGMARVLGGQRWYPISAIPPRDLREESEPVENPGLSVAPQALRMYRGFHQLEPKKIGDFHPDLVIPDVCVCVGSAIHVLYRSDKLNPETGEDEGMIDYIHKHERGVRIYRCDNGAEGEITNVPAWIRKTKDLVKLGDCNGFAYASVVNGKKCRADATPPYPELYTTQSGKCLLVIQGKRRLLALIWGGRLGVEPRGIVH